MSLDTVPTQSTFNFDVEDLADAISSLQLESAWAIAVRVKAGAARGETLDPVSFSVLSEALELTLRRLVFAPINVQ